MANYVHIMLSYICGQLMWKYFQPGKEEEELLTLNFPYFVPAVDPLGAGKFLDRSLASRCRAS